MATGANVHFVPNADVPADGTGNSSHSLFVGHADRAVLAPATETFHGVQILQMSIDSRSSSACLRRSGSRELVDRPRSR